MTYDPTSTTAFVYVEGVDRVDLLIDGWLVLEADGFAYHSSRTSYRQDWRRANPLAAQGHRLLRSGYEDVVFGSEHVAATISAVLRRPRVA